MDDDAPGGDFLRLFNLIADALSGHEQAVAFQLLRCWNKEGKIFPGVARIAERTGLNRTTVMKAIGTLEELGAVKVTRSKGKPNKYELTGKVKPVVHADQSSTPTGRPQRLHQSSTPTTPVVHADPKKPKKKSIEEIHLVNAPKKAKRRWTRVPGNWQPTDDHREQARAAGIDLEHELAQFKDHEFAAPKSDPDACFRTWLRNAEKYSKAKSGSKRPQREPQRGMAPNVRIGGLEALLS